MQFIWPFKNDYHVMYLDAACTQTVIGREEHDYAWIMIMSRRPTLAETGYIRLSTLLQAQGYDVSRLRRVSQRMPGH